LAVLAAEVAVEVSAVVPEVGAARVHDPVVVAVHQVWVVVVAVVVVVAAVALVVAVVVVAAAEAAGGNEL
jgi:hypothetical protein